jgi:hypothetical protein
MPPPAEMTTYELLRAITLRDRLPADYLEACVQELAERIDKRAAA